MDENMRFLVNRMINLVNAWDQKLHNASRDDRTAIAVREFLDDIATSVLAEVPADEKAKIQEELYLYRDPEPTRCEKHKIIHETRECPMCEAGMP